MKLTATQIKALKWIAGWPGKSGNYWRNLGVHPNTISSLENKGLCQAGYRVFTGETTILRRQWHPTAEGRQALKGGE